MKRSLSLLAAIVILLVLVATGSKTPGMLSDKRGFLYLFYCLVLLLTIISVINGVLRVLGGNRSLLSFLYIFFSIAVSALAYWMVIR
ncbi:MAG TPA: hypothetical protein VKR53_11310 [Puia sp.]|nr:hypothetical protein [Puia sp.]